MKLFAAGQDEGVGIGVFFNCYEDVAVEEKRVVEVGELPLAVAAVEEGLGVGGLAGVVGVFAGGGIVVGEEYGTAVGEEGNGLVVITVVPELAFELEGVENDQQTDQDEDDGDNDGCGTDIVVGAVAGGGGVEEESDKGEDDGQKPLGLNIVAKGAKEEENDESSKDAEEAVADIVGFAGGEGESANNSDTIVV